MIKLDDLILRGYFPEELIPPFTTEGLTTVLQRLNNVLDDLSKKTSKCCSHSIPRVKLLRRNLSIPNPLNQILLSQCIVDNWKELEEFVSSSTFSLSTPQINEDSKRALSRKFPFNHTQEEIFLRSTDSRYLLRTDISRFYPTIYTHSIPWALHTKNTAKAHRGDNYIGNKIDRLVRNAMDGQTIGIPIGPDTSLLIAEIITTALDKRLLDELSDNIKGLRYMDDYFLFFRNLSDAERALSKIHIISKEYELELNPTKTNIVSLPQSIELKWIYNLRNHEIRSSAKEQKLDIISFFNKAFDLINNYEEDYVLKYTLSRIKNVLILQDNWDLYESLVLKCIIAEPSVLPYATEIFLSYKNKGYSLDTQKISNTLTEVIVHHSSFNHGYEITWAGWLSKTLNILISKEAAQAMSKVDDCLVALVALDLRSSGLIEEGLDDSKWKRLINVNELYTENWLLVYEALNKGWLQPVDGIDFIKDDAFFSVLQQNGVSFYDDSKQVSITESPCLTEILDSDDLNTLDLNRFHSSLTLY